MNRRDLLKLACVTPLLPLKFAEPKPDTEFLDKLKEFRKPKPLRKKVLDFNEYDISESLRVASNYGTHITHDFSKALGDTIMEKYESLYVDIATVSCYIGCKKHNLGPGCLLTSITAESLLDHYISKRISYHCPHHQTDLSCGFNHRGANFIITSGMIAEIFQTATCGWNGRYLALGRWVQEKTNEGTYTWVYHHAEDVKKPIDYLGSINNRWKAYGSNKLRNHDIVLGCTDEDGFVLTERENWGYINLYNFIL